MRKARCDPHSALSNSCREISDGRQNWHQNAELTTRWAVLAVRDMVCREDDYRVKRYVRIALKSFPTDEG